MNGPTDLTLDPASHSVVNDPTDLTIDSSSDRISLASDRATVGGRSMVGPTTSARTPSFVHGPTDAANRVCTKGTATLPKIDTL